MSQSILDRFNTLVLNADYTPLQVVNWRPAVEDVMSDKAISIANHEGQFVHSEKVALPLPSIIVRKHFSNTYRTASFTRKNAFIAYWTHDPDKNNKNWICGLCGRRMAMSEVTFDHIIPRSKGGKTSWDNIIFAHSSCNCKKGNKFLHEVGMKLHIHTLRPSESDISLQKIMIRFNGGGEVIPEEWMDFIGDAYWNSPLND